MEIFPLVDFIQSKIYNVQSFKLNPSNYELCNHLIHERDAVVNSILEESIIFGHESVSEISRNREWVRNCIINDHD